ncbi:MAG: hypothetical protein IRZ32_16100 [Solirubrobacteraceae bacterium]|nr:hypothetical protein [Solirubrobacteraceae bacterium]
MLVDSETLEEALTADLATLGDRLGDDAFAAGLYRALTRNAWAGPVGGHLVLSWAQAEALVNGLRARAGAGPLALAQTGGEGAVSDAVGGALGRMGWHHRPLNASGRGRFRRPPAG